MTNFRHVLLLAALFLALAPAPAFAACSNPTGNAGAMIYNGAYSVMQYCNGGAWVSMGAVGNTTTGLVGWWKLDETSGTSAADSSGSGSNATVCSNGVCSAHSTTGLWVAGLINNAANLNGTSQFLEATNYTPYNFTASQPFTLAAWIYRNSSSDSDDEIIARDRLSSTHDYGYSLWMTNNGGTSGCGTCTSNCIGMTFVTSTIDTPVFANSTTAAPGAWHHVAAVYDGSGSTSGLKIYVDGVSQTMNCGTGNPITGTMTDIGYLLLGLDDAGASGYPGDLFGGIIDDARVYNRALSAADIKTLYTSTGGWPFTTFTLKGSTTSHLSSNPNAVWGDGTYIYVADYNNNAVEAYTFNGTTFTYKASYSLAGSPTNLWGDGTYIYVADSFSSHIYAFTFNGTTFTTKGNYVTPGNTLNVWGDHKYVYVADDATGLEAFTFNGTTFTLKGSYNTNPGGCGSAMGVWGDAKYIYTAACKGNVVDAFTFDGTTFTLMGSYNTTSQALSVWGDGTYIYAISISPDLYAFSFPGACASPAGHAGDLIYNGGSNHVLQYCDGANWRPVGPVPGAGGGGCSSPAGNEGDLVYNADKTVMQYCDGTNWRAAGGAPIVGPLTGLIHWWKLDEAPGATVAVDSINAINVTLAGTAAFTTSGKMNNALNLPNDGTQKNSTVTTPADILGVSKLTMSMWFQRAVAGGPIQIGQGSNTAANGIDITAWTDGSLIYEIGTGATDGSGTVTSNDTNWHLATLVFDGTQTGDANRLKGYLDGVQQTLTFISGPVPATTTATATGFYIGSGWNVSHDAGNIDDVRVYGRALTAAEVSNLYYATGGQ